jgi:Na+/H+ antiporter NhaD/arsenite permease-like protein
MASTAVYLFLGKMFPVVGATGGRDIVEYLLETSNVVLDKSNAKRNVLVSWGSALFSEFFWRL